jgi:hypothetical protein
VPIAYYSVVFQLLRRKREEIERQDAEPNPAVALAVGLIYVFRTAAGARIMRELETAVRKYAADPAALWKLVKSGAHVEPEHVMDTTAETVDKALPKADR